MGVIVNMVAAIAVVAVALGAVAELHIRVRHVGFPADGAAVGIGLLLLGGIVYLEVDDLGLRGSLGLLLKKPAQPVLPAQGHHVQHVLAEKQEIVAQGHQGKQVAYAVGRRKHTEENDRQVHQGKEPGLHRDDEKQQKAGVGVQGGKAQEQAHVQVIHAGGVARDHAEHIHQHHAGEIEDVEFQGAPLPLHSTPKGIVAQKGNQHKENVAVHQGQRIGNEPPDLPPENIGPAEAQQIVENGVPCKHGDEVHHGIAQGDIEHQVGNALIAVGKAIPLKVTAQIFQWVQLLEIIYHPFYQHRGRMSITEI